MAVGIDTSSESATASTGSTSVASFSWSHAGASSGVKGVLVFTFVNANANDATSVTYGGVDVPAVPNARGLDTATEAGDCKAWFLGTNVPQGTQTVVVNRNNNANVMYAVAITVTANTDTQVRGTPVVLNENQALAEQSVDDLSPGYSSMRFAGVNSGLATHPAAGASSTELQFFPATAGTRSITVVRETTAGQGSRSVGFSAATDDVGAVHLAIGEIGFPVAQPDQQHYSSYRTPPGPILDVRESDWAPLFISFVTIPAPPEIPKSGGSSERYGNTSYPFMLRRVIERTQEPTLEPAVMVPVVDQAVRTWMPAAAALLASFIPVSDAKADVRYDSAPQPVYQAALGPAQPTDAQKFPAIQSETLGFRTAARPVLDIRNYDWTQPVVPVSIVIDPTVAKWAPAFSSELASFRTPKGRTLDVRQYDWELPESDWIFSTLSPPPTIAQTSPAWTFDGDRTAARSLLDVRRYEWSPDEAGWIQPTLPAGPTIAQTAPAWTNYLRNFRVTTRRYLWGIVNSNGSQQESSGTAPPVITPPTVAQTVPTFINTGDRTRDGAKLDLFRTQSIPDIYGVPAYWTLWTPQFDDGGRTRDNAKLDVRRYEWGQPAWIFKAIPAAATIPQTVPAWADDGGRTAARPTLDVRQYEWIQPAWIFKSIPVLATIPQQVPAWVYTGERIRARLPLDVRSYDWAPEFGWVLRPATASVASWAGIFNGELASFRTVSRYKLDIRSYEWLEWVRGIASTASVGHTLHIVGVDVYPDVSGGVDVYATPAAGIDALSAVTAGLGDLTPNAAAGVTVYPTPAAGTDVFTEAAGGLDVFSDASAGLDDVV